MKTITIDSTQCGGGKTVNGIYPKLQYLIQNNIKTLLVLGSVALQEQYQLQFPQITLINDKTKREPSVLKSIMAAMQDGEQVISITHQAYMMLRWNEIRYEYHVIQDEALGNVYSETSIYTKDKTLVNVNWEAHFEIQYDHDQITIQQYDSIQKYPRDVFYRMCIIRASDSSILNQDYKRVTDTNYTQYITPYDYKIMINESDNDSESFNIYSLLNQSIFAGYQSHYVAAAAFDKTPQYWLFKKFGYDMEVTKEFKEHEGNIHIHSYSDPKFKWSNTKRKANNKILNTFHEYVESTATGNILTLHNVSEKQAINNSLALTHNVHGLNKPEYTACNDIVMASALIYSSGLKSFIKQVLLEDMDQKEQDKLITHFASAYLFYQGIMRCSLRTREYNNQQVNVFVLDHVTATALMDYINFKDAHAFELPVEKKESKALSKKEHDAIYREKLKQKRREKLV